MNTRLIKLTSTIPFLFALVCCTLIYVIIASYPLFHFDWPSIFFSVLTVFILYLARVKPAQLPRIFFSFVPIVFFALTLTMGLPFTLVCILAFQAIVALIELKHPARFAINIFNAFLFIATNVFCAYVFTWSGGEIGSFNSAYLLQYALGVTAAYFGGIILSSTFLSIRHRENSLAAFIRSPATIGMRYAAFISLTLMLCMLLSNHPLLAYFIFISVSMLLSFRDLQSLLKRDLNQTLEKDLERAISSRELQLYYQPQLEAKTQRVIGAEALLRWEHPQFGLISPAKFIPIAEATGAIIPIGEWVMREACQQLLQWEKMGFPLQVSVNLSSRQFQQQGLARRFQQIMEQEGVDPQRIQIEITESVAIDLEQHGLTKMHELKALHVHLLLDDFGTGYSSLRYLQELPIDCIKIDRSFIAQIADCEKSEAIVRAIVALAQRLGLGTVAEGIETHEQLQKVLELECDRLQGYLFGKPMPAQQFLEAVTALNGANRLKAQNSLPPTRGSEEGERASLIHI